MRTYSEKNFIYSKRYINQTMLYQECTDYNNYIITQKNYTSMYYLSYMILRNPDLCPSTHMTLHQVDHTSFFLLCGLQAKLTFTPRQFYRMITRQNEELFLKKIRVFKYALELFNFFFFYL